MKRSIRIAGHRTSLSLEAPFWDAVKEIAAARGVSLASVVGEIDAGRGRQNLSSAIRVYILEKARAGELSRRTA